MKQMPKLWVEDTDKIVNSDYYGEWQTEPYDPGEVQNVHSFSWHVRSRFLHLTCTLHDAGHNPTK